MTVYDLPLLNALLNTTSAVLLFIGYIFIRQRRISLHRGFMIAAFCMSVLFLIFYLVYHYNVGSVRFTGQGAVRPFYFAVLISHTILAAAVPPMAIVTLTRAFRSRFDKHRRLARWTLPIWIYVSVTGVLIYVLLYQLYPSGA